MPYFTIFQSNLFPSYDLSVEEKRKLDTFLCVLEDSEVWKIIKEETEKDRRKGGRPSYNPYRLFAAVIYAFSKHSGSVRKIEESITFDLRFIYLMDQKIPTYVTISKFLNNVVVKHHKEIFITIIKTIIKKYQIDIDDVFLDGTKIEANANKYLFVWKPTAHHKKLNDKIKEILIKYFPISNNKVAFTSKEIGSYLNLLEQTLNKNNIPIVSGKGKRIGPMVKDYNSLSKYLLKCLEYEEKEQICGPNRNSYFKTDHDATAMCLKEDYYSGLGSSMHAGYNVQIIVSKGIILDYFVCQDRNDFYTLVPFLNEFNKNYGFFPKRLCADSGYGSLMNYQFIKANNIENYVKHQNWAKYVSGEYVDLYKFDSNKNLFCLNGKKAEIVNHYNGRHPHSKNVEFYLIGNCTRCKYKEYCMKNNKDKKAKERLFEASYENYILRDEANRNLLSPKGIEMRVNRSSQVEGTFGVIKQDMDYDRLRRRGLENASGEIMLVCLGYVIRKLFSLIEGKAKLDYWKAPENLQSETIKDVNLSKLMKKKNKGKNKELRSSYKHKKSC